MLIGTIKKIDLGEVERSFDAMKRRGKQLGQAFRVIKAEMRADQRDHASHTAGPDGAWAPLAASTIAKRAQLGRARKRPLGRLVTAVTYKATAQGATAQSKVPWSGVHQEGGDVGRGAEVPARPFLWISERLLQKAVQVVSRVVVDAFGRS